jgi:hypothetical protein
LVYWDEEEVLTLASLGKSSTFMTQGMGPKPMAKAATYISRLPIKILLIHPYRGTNRIVT